MTQTDSIMRMIEMFGVFLRRIAGRFESDELDLAEKDLDAAARHFSGVSFALVRDFESGLILRMFETGDGLDAHKLYVLAGIFQQDARLAILTGDEKRAFRNRVKALELQLSVFGGSEDHSDLKQLAAERVDALVAELSNQGIPADLQARLSRFNDEKNQKHSWGVAPE